MDYALCRTDRPLDEVLLAFLARRREAARREPRLRATPRSSGASSRRLIPLAIHLFFRRRPAADAVPGDRLHPPRAARDAAAPAAPQASSSSPRARCSSPPPRSPSRGRGSSGPAQAVAAVAAGARARRRSCSTPRLDALPARRPRAVRARPRRRARRARRARAGRARDRRGLRRRRARRRAARLRSRAPCAARSSAAEAVGRATPTSPPASPRRCARSRAPRPRRALGKRIVVATDLAASAWRLDVPPPAIDGPGGRVRPEVTVLDAARGAPLPNLAVVALDAEPDPAAGPRGYRVTATVRTPAARRAKDVPLQLSAGAGAGREDRDPRVRRRPRRRHRAQGALARVPGGRPGGAAGRAARGRARAGRRPRGRARGAARGAGARRGRRAVAGALPGRGLLRRVGARLARLAGPADARGRRGARRRRTSSKYDVVFLLNVRSVGREGGGPRAASSRAAAGSSSRSATRSIRRPTAASSGRSCRCRSTS